MQTYTIYLTLTVKEDIRSIYRYIAYELQEPIVANNYRKGIIDAIENLAIYGGAVAVNQQEYIQRHYGPKARTITFKKVTVIYNVIDNLIIVRRVIASSLIK